MSSSRSGELQKKKRQKTNPALDDAQKIIDIDNGDKKMPAHNYLAENPKSLAAEFPHADPECIAQIWEDCDKDCDRARRAIREQLGLPPEELSTTTTTATNKYGAFSLTEIVGDMFADTDQNGDVCLAHCVSQDLAMGKGIAVLFKKKFGRVPELKAQNAKIGECAILTRKASTTTAFIYYMITKARYFHKPTYTSLRQSLEYTKNHMVAHHQTELKMPRIGCGLDGLEWKQVRRLIQETFQHTSIQITVYRLE